MNAANALKSAAAALLVLLAAGAAGPAQDKAAKGKPPVGPVEIAVSGDSRGNLIGTVSKNLGTLGLPGERVAVTGGGWSRAAVTGENGFFAVGLPLDARGAVTVEAAGARLAVDASDLPLRLTARPAAPRLSLEGRWRILVDPPADWRQAAGWRDIDVPSNWEMKGFRAATGTAVMRREFSLPASWAGKVIKLRADGIYSKCEAWLNGARLGSHDGGATPVELDLTAAAKCGGPNTLDVFIRARSRATDIDHMSVYAYFEIAGIWRPIEVFAVEPDHVARLGWSVAFDRDYKNADVSVDATVANAQATPVKDRTLAVLVRDPDSRVVGKEVRTVSLGPWEEKTVPVVVHVDAPAPWTAERPRVYTLEAAYDRSIAEAPLGFRQMEIKGARFTINGKGAKLFGACLHCSDPVDGRAISPKLVEKDLDLMKGCNLNAIRTSHYPPHPHTPEYADRVGLYIEDEGPACWSETDDLRDVPLYMGIYAAFVERDRNHPSVVYWSMCNESNYTRIFQMTQTYIKAVDPTRPSSGTYAPVTDKADMIVHHHPTNLHEFIRAQAGVAKPVFMDECQTVFHGWGDLAISLELDPGMHDYWVEKVPDVVRACFETENQVGTMIWAWVDDAFQIPGRGIEYWRRDMTPIRYEDAVYAGPGHGYVGDCVWGIVDGWRRPRPEWERCRQVYSPIQIPTAPLAPGPVRVPVFNQNVFENLSIYDCRWTLGEHGGSLRPDVMPRSQGAIPIPAVASADDTLELRFYDGARLVNAFRLAFKPHAREAWVLGAPAGLAEEKDLYLSGASAVYLRGGKCELAYDRVSGEMMWALADNTQVLLKGPMLHVLKSEDQAGHDPSGWKLASEAHEPGRIDWNGAFGKEWKGGYRIRLDGDGNAEFGYEFTYLGPDLWVRELGLAFDVPLSFARLAWDRDAEYTLYPADDIGRPRGLAFGHATAPQTVPPGARPFSLDDHAWGSNDFRSAKRRIYGASLTGPGGKLRVVSDGAQTLRCTLTPHEISMKVLDFYGGSGGPKEWSVEGFHYGAGRLIKKGETVKGVVKLKLLG